MPRRCANDYDAAYQLDAGDKLRVVVYGQEGLTNTYAIDAGGAITMPLIGSVPARGRTPAGLAAEITGRLRNGYIRDPSVAVEIESYRPFFILGEVAAPGQYPYVPNMSVESAVAIAGGFSPRARRDRVTVTHTDGSGSMRVWCRSAPRSAPAIPSRRRTLVLNMPHSDQPLRILHAVARPSAASSVISSTSPTARPTAATMSASSPTALPAANGPRRRWRRSRPGSSLAFIVSPFAANLIPTDVLVWARFKRLIRPLNPDVLHGHGAKAGAFIRLKRARKTIRVYTPHGSSLHYPLNTLKGVSTAVSNAR